MKRRLYLLFFLTSGFCFSQHLKYNQFWGELRFNETLNKRWATEWDFRTTHSGLHSESNLFHYSIRKAYAGWAHYYLNARWKISTGIGFFDNYNPQGATFSGYNEWRFTLQSIYYIHRVGYTLSTRMRAELRDRKNSLGDFDKSFRYRQEIKYIQPINNQRLRAGTIYGVASEEIYLAANTKEEGVTFFNKNRCSIGAGYVISDTFQIEAAYLNDYVPRDNTKTSTNVFFIRVTCNNLIHKAVKKVKTLTEEPVLEDETENP